MSAPTYLPGVEPTKYTLITQKSIIRVTCHCHLRIHLQNCAEYYRTVIAQLAAKKTFNSRVFIMFTWSLTGHALWFAESTPRVLVPGRMPGTPGGPSWRTLATPLHLHCCPSVTAETKGSSTFWFRDKRNRGVSITGVFFFDRDTVKLIDSPLCFLVPVSSDEVGGQDDDSEAFLVP